MHAGIFLIQDFRAGSAGAAGGKAGEKTAVLRTTFAGGKSVLHPTVDGVACAAVGGVGKEGDEMDDAGSGGGNGWLDGWMNG